ncbi:MAG: hypothetical protein GY714_17840 [Desulfobacterales bacterium]|nr:hypothetical protein [Desulfobacterales bacterium]MCP4163165.1 hypothetical protein [Deltaproteobacteria bacterium]
MRTISNWVKDGKLQRDIGVGKKDDLVIIAGDLNSTWFQSSIKDLMNTGLIDAYREANWRPGPTWSLFKWFPSLLRIDYIFVSSNLFVKNAWTG